MLSITDNLLCFQLNIVLKLLQLIEALSSTEIFLKAVRSAAFKNISGFQVSAKRCNYEQLSLRLIPSKSKNNIKNRYNFMCYLRDAGIVAKLNWVWKESKHLKKICVKK